MTLHKTQLGILNKLLFARESKFSDLKIDKRIENNTFQFHLKKVIADGYVFKNKNGMYSLTLSGKKIANHINVQTNSLVQIRKVSVHLYCIRKHKGILQALIYTRKKHPFFGRQGFPTGKIELGENFVDAAKRELKEETNLEGEPILFNIVHYLVKDKKTKILLDDKLFFDFFIKGPKGKLVKTIEGDYVWVDVAELKKHIIKPFNTLRTYEIALDRIQQFSGVVSFEEFEQFTDDF